MGCVMSLSYGGITRIRFRGFDLSPCIKAPLLVDTAKVNLFWFGEKVLEKIGKFLFCFGRGRPKR